MWLDRVPNARANTEPVAAGHAAHDPAGPVQELHAEKLRTRYGARVGVRALQARRFGLRFTCDDCGHFDRAPAACRHEWPTASHRRERYRLPAGEPGAAAEVVFCKEFEIR